MEIGKIIGQGITADVHLWEDEKVVKLFSKDTPKLSVEFEFDINSKIYESSKEKGITMPKPFQIVEVKDRIGIIFERIQGRTMLEEMSNKPWKIKFFAKKLADLHHGIHQCVNSSLNPYKLDIQSEIDKALFLSEKVKKKLLEMVAELEDSNVICHGDFHPDNIMLSNKGPIIIDWTNARRGNKILDVARTLIMIKYSNTPPDKPFIIRAVLKQLRNTLYKEYIKHYLKISGISIQEVEKWEAPMGAARLNENIPMEEKNNLLQMINNKVT